MVNIAYKMAKIDVFTAVYPSYLCCVVINQVYKEIKTGNINNLF
ncbi:hypothetical protein N1F78_06690 [Seonamhaeicola sp. MEBiC1930]